MTSPDRYQPPKAYSATSLKTLQDASKKQEAEKKNGWLQTQLENIQKALRFDLLGGHLNVPSLIQGFTEALAYAFTGTSGGMAQIEAWATENKKAIATLQTVAATAQVTQAWISLGLQDLATFPRVLLIPKPTINIDNSTSLDGSANVVIRGTTGSADGNGTHSHSFQDNYQIFAHSHTLNSSVSWTIPMSRPASKEVWLTPIIVDRKSYLWKFKVITGKDTAFFGLSSYLLAVMIYNPETQNLEKVWGSGNLKDQLVNSTTEYAFDMGINQYCEPGQLLFAAVMQDASGFAQGTRAIAAIDQPGITQAGDSMLRASNYILTNRNYIPDSTPLSTLGWDNAKIPWMAITTKPMKVVDGEAVPA